MFREFLVCIYFFIVIPSCGYGVLFNFLMLIIDLVFCPFFPCSLYLIGLAVHFAFLFCCFSCVYVFPSTLISLLESWNRPTYLKSAIQDGGT